MKASSSFTDKLSLRSKGSDYDDPLSPIKNEMARLETQFSEGAKAIDKEGRNRKSTCALTLAFKAYDLWHWRTVLAQSLLELSEQLTAYSTTESAPPMTAAFRKVAEGIRKLADLNNGLAVAECVTLADALMYESAEAKEAKVGGLLLLTSSSK
jgi:hypothetical protein